MPAHSGRQELAPFPDWAARYLVFKDQRRREIVLRHGDLSGSWPVHAREDEMSPLSGVGGGRMPSLEQRPDLWFDARAAINDFDHLRGLPLPVIESGREEPDTDQTGLVPDTAHQPSLAFIPYLLTGDRYYAEEMAFWANYSMLRTYNGESDYQRGSDGILWANEVRGFGWALRNIADAAAYSPDAAVASYLGQRVAANLAWLDQFVVDHTIPGNPFNVMWPSKFLRPEGTEFIAPWELSYLAHGIDRANAHGFTGGKKMLDAITDLRLMLFRSEPTYPRVNAAPVVLHIGDLWTDSFHQTLQELADANTNEDYHRDFAGFYGPEARLDLMAAIRNGRPGASGAYDYLWPFIGVEPTGCFFDGIDRPDLQCRAGWAVDFYPEAPDPGGADGDADGVDDAGDNCPALPNPDQSNADGDVFGDACDADDDGDTFADADELAAGSDPLNPASTPEVCDGVDNDLDGNTDEGSPNHDGDLLADCVDADDDNDGRPDFIDPRPFVPNVAPGIESPGTQKSLVGVTIAPVPVRAADFDGDPLQWSAQGLPAGLGMAQDGIITGTPAADAAPQNSVTVTVSDGLIGASTTFDWTIDNTPAGDDVVVDTPLVDVTFDNIGAAGYTHVVSATPPSPEQLPAGFTVTGLPAFDITTTAAFNGPVVLCLDVSALNLDAAAFALLRVLHGEDGLFVDRTILQPDTPSPDVAAMKICARVTSLSPFALASIEQVEENGAPIVTAPAPPPATVGVAITPVAIAATDPDGDTLTISASGLPPGLEFGAMTNTIAGTPLQAGNFTVTITATDGTDQAAATFSWTVLLPDVGLTLGDPGPQTNTEGDRVRLRLVWDGPAPGRKRSARPSFSASGLPPGLHINRLHGVIFGHVSRRAEGVHRVTVTLHMNNERVSQSFVWTIAAKNHKPRLTHLDDQRSKSGQSVRLTLHASDPDGDALTFSAESLPQGLSLDPRGVISGAPNDRGRHQVTITVSDGRATDHCTFDWTVEEPSKKSGKK
jgi:hypothetical protein